MFAEAERSPLLCAGVGIVVNCGPPERIRVLCQSPKMKSLSRLTGPPKDPPNWLKLYFGLSGAKKLRASRALFRTYSNKEPWKLFVPLLTFVITTPLSVRPYSAE